MYEKWMLPVGIVVMLIVIVILVDWLQHHPT